MKRNILLIITRVLTKGTRRRRNNAHRKARERTRHRLTRSKDLYRDRYITTRNKGDINSSQRGAMMMKIQIGRRTRQGTRRTSSKNGRDTRTNKSSKSRDVNRNNRRAKVFSRANRYTYNGSSKSRRRYNLYVAISSLILRVRAKMISSRRSTMTSRGNSDQTRTINGRGMRSSRSRYRVRMPTPTKTNRFIKNINNLYFNRANSLLNKSAYDGTLNFLFTRRDHSRRANRRTYSPNKRSTRPRLTTNSFVTRTKRNYYYASYKTTPKRGVRSANNRHRSNDLCPRIRFRLLRRKRANKSNGRRNNNAKTVRVTSTTSRRNTSASLSKIFTNGLRSTISSEVGSANVQTNTRGRSNGSRRSAYNGSTTRTLTRVVYTRSKGYLNGTNTRNSSQLGVDDSNLFNDDLYNLSSSVKNISRYYSRTNSNKGGSRDCGNESLLTRSRYRRRRGNSRSWCYRRIISPRWYIWE